MKYSVLTEGRNDVILLQRLLEPEIREASYALEIVAAGGWSGADALGRSILATRPDETVILFVAADSIDENAINRRRQFLEASLSEFGKRHQWHILLVVPKIEGLFFRDEAVSVLEDAIGRPLSDIERLRGYYEPRKVLESLIPETSSPTGSGWDRLLSKDLSPLRETPEIRELLSLLPQTNSVPLLTGAGKKNRTIN